ncbi:MAG: thymidine phosphorylase [Lachnospiraceae bacterium]|nr:thymidine phosphorylase [Lachnospiraceae bacterium]
MNMSDIIIKKRDGGKLSAEEIEFFIKGVADESIPDYQISALLMAIFLKGMDMEETSDLTFEMMNSGEVLDFNMIPGIKVDKHSTGGVGDTVTLVIAPLVASLGAPVVKMSGRGLGFSGGTIDKLEAINGFSCSLSDEKALANVKKIGIVIMEQTKNLVPADKKLYSLRDVTGTVSSIPLIASSIMSKKLASGADAIVLDVKYGSGAFMKKEEDARRLAGEMFDIGKALGRKVICVISSMDEPLGFNIGNSLEVIEAFDILKGKITEGDLLTVSLEIGSHMLMLAGIANDEAKAKDMLMTNLRNGKGFLKLKEMIALQGGDTKVAEDYSLLPSAKESLDVLAGKEGYIYKIDASQIGRASVETGAGRAKKGDAVDLGAGIIMKSRLGDYVKKGDVLAKIYSSGIEKCQSSARLLKQAITISDLKPEPKKLILDVIK